MLFSHSALLKEVQYQDGSKLKANEIFEVQTIKIYATYDLKSIEIAKKYILSYAISYPEIELSLSIVEASIHDPCQFFKKHLHLLRTNNIIYSEELSNWKA
jgi:hypothetical protein